MGIKMIPVMKNVEMTCKKGTEQDSSSNLHELKKTGKVELPGIDLCLLTHFGVRTGLQAGRSC